MSNESKRVLVPWSGGADSTVVILAALEAKHRVWYASFDCKQPHTQQKAEAQARETMIPLIKKRYGEDANFYPAESRLEIDIRYTDSPATQMPAWFMHALCMVANKNREYIFDEVHMGYVLGDDSAMSMPHLKIAFEHMCRALYNIDRDPPKLMFPMCRMRKGGILESLKAFGLHQHVWVCELPQLYDDGWRACGQCVSCHKHAGAEADMSVHRLWAYNLLHNYDHRTPTEDKGPTNEASEQTPQHDDDVSQPDEPARGGPVEGDVGVAGSELRKPSGEEPQSETRTESDEESCVAQVFSAREQHADQHEDSVRG